MLFVDELDCCEEDILCCFDDLFDDGILICFGLLFDIEFFGGVFILVVMSVLEVCFEEIVVLFVGWL